MCVLPLPSPTSYLCFHSLLMEPCCPRAFFYVVFTSLPVTIIIKVGFSPPFTELLLDVACEALVSALCYKRDTVVSCLVASLLDAHTRFLRLLDGKSLPLLWTSCMSKHAGNEIWRQWIVTFCTTDEVTGAEPAVLSRLPILAIYGRYPTSSSV